MLLPSLEGCFPLSQLDEIANVAFKYQRLVQQAEESGSQLFGGLRWSQRAVNREGAPDPLTDVTESKKDVKRRAVQVPRETLLEPVYPTIQCAAQIVNRASSVVSLVAGHGRGTFGVVD